MVFLARISESELVDPGENTSCLFEVDHSLVSQFSRGTSLHLLARTFHPSEWFARVDSITRVQGDRNRVVGEGRQGRLVIVEPLWCFIVLSIRFCPMLRP